MVCYRRHGHNEGDDPSYTQPLMYRVIDETRSVRMAYTESLVRRGDLSLDEAEAALDDFDARLERVLDEVRAVPVPELSARARARGPVRRARARDRRGRRGARAPGRRDDRDPRGFHRPPQARATVRRSAPRSSARARSTGRSAEALAIGSLLSEGVDVRLVGQDTRRGTFSQRHAALVDYDTGAQYVPLAPPGRGRAGCFTVRDTLLSEYAALGFEYGYSVEAPRALVAWEAQFGDFVNGAEIIIDNFLVAAEDKWGQGAGLVMLLPHGYEGQGPEHSSGRIERFLSLCARNNLRVAVPSTAAQYFHLLRAQVRREHVTPLVVFTPKSLLRAAVTRSDLDELVLGPLPRGDRRRRRDARRR